MKEMQETQVWSLGGKIPWGRKRQPTPVLLPGKSHGRRSLVGYSPGSCKELDLTERLDTHVFQRKMLFYERVGYFSLQLKTAYVLEYSCWSALCMLPILSCRVLKKTSGQGSRLTKLIIFLFYRGHEIVSPPTPTTQLSLWVHCDKKKLRWLLM